MHFLRSFDSKDGRSALPNCRVFSSSSVSRSVSPMRGASTANSHDIFNDGCPILCFPKSLQPESPRRQGICAMAGKLVALVHRVH